MSGKRKLDTEAAVSSTASMPAQKKGRKTREASGDERKTRKMGAAEKPRTQQGKGLRHFSTIVCRKVEERGKTTYSEVADELISELAKGDEDKNVRRRVYDALNVLMAMNIISKDKKEITWIGLPKNSDHEIIQKQLEKKELEERIRKKQIHLQELLLQEISFKNLISRNQQLETEGKVDHKNNISLPFILVNTGSETKINCEMLEDRTQYYFEFDAPFEIHDDIEVLRRMNLNRCTPAQARELVPSELHKYLPGNMQSTENTSTEALASFRPMSNISSSSPTYLDDSDCDDGASSS